MALGRPTSYKPEYCELLMKHMKDGYSFESFASIAECHWDTLYEWVKVHPDFSEAKRIGLGHLLLVDERTARAGSTGQLRRHARTVSTTNPETKETREEKFYDAATFSQSYHIFLMKNRYPRLYRDKIVIESESSDVGKMEQVFDEVMSDPALAAAAAIIAKKLAEE